MLPNIRKSGSPNLKENVNGENVMHIKLKESIGNFLCSLYWRKHLQRMSPRIFVLFLFLKKKEEGKLWCHTQGSIVDL